jgi:hypothetical protein
MGRTKFRLLGCPKGYRFKCDSCCYSERFYQYYRGGCTDRKWNDPGQLNARTKHRNRHDRCVKLGTGPANVQRGWSSRAYRLSSRLFATFSEVLFMCGRFVPKAYRPVPLHMFLVHLPRLFPIQFPLPNPFSQIFTPS